MELDRLLKKYGKDYYEEGKAPLEEGLRVGDLVKDLNSRFLGIYLGQYPDNSIDPEGSKYSMVHLIGEEFSGEDYKNIRTENLKLISRKKDRKNLEELEKEIKDKKLKRLREYYGESLK